MRLGGAYVAAVSAEPVTRTLDAPTRTIAARQVRALLGAAGLSPSDLDGLIVTPPGLHRAPDFMWGCQLAEHLGVSTGLLAQTECGGASALGGVRDAALAVASGHARAVAVVGMDLRGLRVPDWNHMLWDAVTRQFDLYGPYDAMYGVGAPVAYYAMSAQRYLHETGCDQRLLAEIPVALRRHAASEPLAQFREPITVDDVLASRTVAPPLRLLDCSPFASGAAAALITDRERAGADPVAVRAVGEHHHPSHFVAPREPLTTFPAVREAARKAYDAWGRGPDAVEVAEVYGVFSTHEAMVCEDLGLLPRGGAPRAFAAGRAEHIDPSGGRLSLGHPAGATPLYALGAVVRAMRAGRATGLVHAEHGMLNGSLVTILERERATP